MRLSHLLLAEWRVLAVGLVILLGGIVLLLVRFIQPRVFYDVRHLIHLIKARQLFLRKLGDRDVDSATFVTLIGQDYRQEVAESDLQVVLTRVSRIRELVRLLNPSRRDVPSRVKLPDGAVCVEELADTIRGMASRLIADSDYNSPLVPAHFVLSAVAERIESHAGRRVKLQREADIEHWFLSNPMTIQQITEMLIGVVFALSLRERVARPGRRSRVLRFSGMRPGEVRPYEQPVQGIEGIRRMIEAGESRTLEFKRTLKTNVHTSSTDPEMEFEVLRAIAGFLNAEGGTLLVGIDDNGIVQGYDSNLFHSADHVKRYIGSKVRDLIPGTMGQLVETTVEMVEEKEVVRIDCRPASKPAFLRKRGGGVGLFVRFDGFTRELDVMEVTSYIDERFGQG